MEILSTIDSQYCYPGTSVLVNKLGIKTSEQLHATERKLTSIRQTELLLQPTPQTFDFSYLKKIHHHLFQDMYSWAGEMRSVAIAKDNIFCLPQFIQKSADTIFAKLRHDNFLEKQNPQDFITKMSYYMGEVNALHPFREGNGRTQRMFFLKLAKHAGYDLDFSLVSRQDLLSADVAAMNGQYERLNAVLQVISSPTQQIAITARMASAQAQSENKNRSEHAPAKSMEQKL